MEFFKGVDRQSHQAFIYSSPHQSLQDGIEGDWPEYTERLSEALAVPRTRTGQGCRSPHVLMGQLGRAPRAGRQGVGWSGRRWPENRGLQGVFREPMSPLSLPLKCGWSCSWAQAGGIPPGMSPCLQDVTAASTHTSCLSLTRASRLQNISSQHLAVATACLALPGPHLCRFCPLKNTHSTVNIFFLPFGFLNNTFFPLSYFSIRMQYVIHMTYTVCVNQLFML